MPIKKGPAKTRRIGYSIPPDLEKVIDMEMKNKGFSDQNELITVALRFYFNREEFDQWIQIFLASEEGLKAIDGVLERILKSEEGKILVREAKTK